MKQEDGPQRAGRLAKLSLRKLGAYAMEEALIEGIEIREESVTIVQGQNRFVLPPEQASTFLIGMLRGRSWFVEEDEPPPAHTALESEKGRAAAPVDPTLSTMLDSLLAFTSDVGILEGYQKDEATQSVRLDIPACSTTLSYVDALNYLLDCLQHELRRLRGEEDF